MADQNTIFRKKSLDRVSSPEQLNDYIKVATPGMWMVLLAIVIFLVGMIVWGALGKLETTVRGAVVFDGANSAVYVSEESVAAIMPGQTLRADGMEFVVGEKIGGPMELDPDADSYLIHAGGFEDGEWVCRVAVESAGEKSGTFECEIVTDSVSPLSFVMN